MRRGLEADALAVVAGRDEAVAVPPRHDAAPEPGDGLVGRGVRGEVRPDGAVGVGDERGPYVAGAVVDGRPGPIDEPADAVSGAADPQRAVRVLGEPSHPVIADRRSGIDGLPRALPKPIGLRAPGAYPQVPVAGGVHADKVVVAELRD